uniref:Uncharacterized protein n=1 Tax=Leersia perrieri TaxID=77586 RepID=A0A0D9X6H3_9ORYZ
MWRVVQILCARIIAANSAWKEELYLVEFALNSIAAWEQLSWMKISKPEMFSFQEASTKHLVRAGKEEAEIAAGNEVLDWLTSCRSSVSSCKRWLYVLDIESATAHT